jgi:hypothetical protein
MTEIVRFILKVQITPLTTQFIHFILNLVEYLFVLKAHLLSVNEFS